MLAPLEQAHISWAGQDTRGYAKGWPCINRVANRLHLQASFATTRTVVGHRYFQVYQDASQPRRTCALAWVPASICPAQLPYPAVTCASAQLLCPELFVEGLVARCSGAFHDRQPGSPDSRSCMCRRIRTPGAARHAACRAFAAATPGALSGAASRAAPLCATACAPACAAPQQELPAYGAVVWADASLVLCCTAAVSCCSSSNLATCARGQLGAPHSVVVCSPA